MQFRPLEIPEVVEIVPRRFGDERGWFSEVFKLSAMAENGIEIPWVQDNQSFSAPVGTVRGLHFQAPPFAQDKLVRVLRGAIFDVAADIRAGSPTYGCWAGLTLSAEQGNQLLIPAGFAHGFMTLAPDTEVIYKVSAPYAPESEGALLWNDADIGIAWPDIGAEATLSPKDAAAPLLRDHQPVFHYEERT